mgnify:CR=1 FL=1
MTGMTQETRLATPTRQGTDTVNQPTHRPTTRFGLAAWTTALAVAATAAAAVALLLAIAPAATAAHGDRYSYAEVTDPDTATSAPAFPGAKAFWAGACDIEAGTAAVGALPTDPFAHCIDHYGTVPGVPGDGFWAPTIPPLPAGVAPGGSGPDGWSGPIPSWRLADVNAAGDHPDGSTSFCFSRSPVVAQGASASSYGKAPDGASRNIRVSLPPGVVADPTAVAQCPGEDLRVSPARCHPSTQVGVSTITLSGNTWAYPVYNVEPRDGKAAELLISGTGLATTYTSNVPVVADVRADSDFGVDAIAADIPAGLALQGQTFTVWGVPWAASHDRYRPASPYCGAPNSVETFGMPLTGLPGGSGGPTGGVPPCLQEPQGYHFTWGPIRPFLSLQTECDGLQPVTRVFTDNWHTDVFDAAESPAPAMAECEKNPFDPAVAIEPTSSRADSASGLGVDIAIPQNDDPPAGVAEDPSDATGAPAFWKSDAGRATAHLDKTVVRLPDGLSVNPSAATGLQGCSDSEMGVTAVGSPYRFDEVEPTCPDGSRLGTVEATTPLLDETLTGELYLASPKSTDPASGEMLRMFLVVRNVKRGLLAKVHGSAVADPATGRLTATFDDNPRVPVENIRVDLKGGERGVLALPQACGSRSVDTELTPWTAPAGGPVRSLSDGFAIGEDCSNGFAPALQAGMDTPRARSNGTFSFRFTRPQGQQYLRGLTAKLPQGLLASVKGVGLCSKAAANAGACPAASKIGVVDAKAGSGDPFVLEEKGEVFLTDGYKGGEYGLAVKIRPIAGPFRGNMELSPIVVRQAIHVDRKTAQVTAISDVFPLIHHGVPLRVREVTVLVNRARFMLNPSDCAAKRVGADLASDQGATADLTNAFQASDCASLAFKPKLALRLTGKKQVRTGKHPGIRAVVTQRGIAEAGIEKAVVRLPKSLALDVDNAQALCEFDDGTKPDLEKHCPKGSIVGRARAVSPLLNDPLVGNVYFVKNVRRSASGNLIRTLPMIVVTLRGEIAVNLVGESNVDKGKLVNTFDEVPDAPITRFNLNIKGGKNGILAVTRTRRSLINLCASGRQVAEADMDGQNGRRHDRDIAMRKPCAKKQRRAAKRPGRARGGRTS